VSQDNIHERESKVRKVAFVGNHLRQPHPSRPIRAADRAGYEHYKIDPSWNTFRDFFARLKKQGMGINLASYVGATQSIKGTCPKPVGLRDWRVSGF